MGIIIVFAIAVGYILISRPEKQFVMTDDEQSAFIELMFKSFHHKLHMEDWDKLFRELGIDSETYTELSDKLKTRIFI